MEIYLDTSATTKPMKESVDALMNAIQIEYGNPSSLHKKGFQAEQLVNKAKNQLAMALSCDKQEIIFTSGATESNNLAIIGLAMAQIRKGRKIITTSIEHPAVMNTVDYLEKQGFEIVKISPNENNEFSAMDFYNAVDENTILVTCMYVNNETGLMLPVEEIAKACKRKNPNVTFHTDAVQAFMKLKIKLKNSDIDMLSLSGHKIYAPKGIGALYIKKGVRIVPISYGGGQQNALRSGTEPVPLIAALGEAVECQSNKIEENLKHYAFLKDYLFNKIKNNQDIIVNLKNNTVPYIVSLAVYGIRSEVMLHFLEQFEIYVSSGSACSKGKHSYVLSSLGIEKQIADETIRISFSPDTTTDMIDELVLRINEGIHSLAKQR